MGKKSSFHPFFLSPNLSGSRMYNRGNIQRRAAFPGRPRNRPAQRNLQNSRRPGRKRLADEHECVTWQLRKCAKKGTKHPNFNTKLILFQEYGGNRPARASLCPAADQRASRIFIWKKTDRCSSVKRPLVSIHRGHDSRTTKLEYRNSKQFLLFRESCQFKQQFYLSNWRNNKYKRKYKSKLDKQRGHW